MQDVTRNEVDEIFKEETHMGETFAEVRVGNETGWIRLDE